jgi:IS605 OrfB family transposase
VVSPEEGVAIATERLKYLYRGRRGDGSGRAFRRKLHRFVYASLLRKVHALARRRGIEAVEVSPADSSAIGMLKYAPQLSLSKDVAAAYVIGRRALGLAEELPRGYASLLRDASFLEGVAAFYRGLVPSLEAEVSRERNPYIRRRLRRELGRAREALVLYSSLQGSPGSPLGSTGGRNPAGTSPWRVLRAGLFLPLLELRLPRDLGRLKPVRYGTWEGWKVSPGPHRGGGPAAIGCPAADPAKPVRVADSG